MNFFKTFSLTWWQGSIFKSAMVATGIALALTWPEIFSLIPLAFWWTLAVALAAYLSVIWWRQ